MELGGEFADLWVFAQAEAVCLLHGDDPGQNKIFSLLPSPFSFQLPRCSIVEPAAARVVN